MRFVNLELGGNNGICLRKEGEEGDFRSVCGFGEKDEDKRLRVGEQVVSGRTIWEVILVISGRIKDLLETKVKGYTHKDQQSENRGKTMIDGAMIGVTFIWRSVDMNTIGTIVIVKGLGDWVE